MEYEGVTPVKQGDVVLRWDWIKELWHEATVVDALASQFTVTWTRPTSHNNDPIPYSFDFLFYTDKGTSWKLK